MAQSGQSLVSGWGETAFLLLVGKAGLLRAGLGVPLVQFLLRVGRGGERKEVLHWTTLTLLFLAIVNGDWLGLSGEGLCLSGDGLIPICSDGPIDLNGVPEDLIGTLGVFGDFANSIELLLAVP